MKASTAGSVAAGASEVRDAVRTVFRMESARLVAGLSRLVRDLDLAEELAQDALVAALERWPESGVPDRPGAWLMAAARNRAVDRLRRESWLGRRREALAGELGPSPAPAPDADGAELGDDLLRLAFVACHPVLLPEARVALALRLLCGLGTDEIARAFLVPETTVAQRIVRAKRTLAEARVPFELPGGAEREARLASVLQVVYLVFNEGYAPSSGTGWLRPALCEEALRLGRVLARIAPEEPEVQGLSALMELQASRAAARVGPGGEPVLLLDQDRGRWDRVLIGRGLAALERAAAPGRALGPYALQASIAACHARAPTASETDWPRIVALYDALAQVAPSPVVELNRAVAVSMALGPAAAMEIVDALSEEPSLRGYHLLPCVRGELLLRLGRVEAGRAELRRAAALAASARERKLLLERAASGRPVVREAPASPRAAAPPAR